MRPSEQRLAELGPQTDEELEQRVAERTTALRGSLQQLEHLRDIVNRSPAIVFLWRNAPGWPVDFVSDNIRQMGYVPADFTTGRVPAKAFIHPEDIPRLETEVASHQAAGRLAYEQEYRVRTKAGEIRWVEERTHAWHDATGAVTHHQGIVLDVTDRKRAEEALRESEARFRTLTESMPIGISLMNPDLSFDYVNPRFTEILGYALKDLPNKQTWFEKAYPDPAYRSGVVKTWRGDLVDDPQVGRINERTFTVRCKNGSDKTIHFRALLVEGGKQVVTYSDMTEREQAQQQLRESEERYRILAEAAPDMVYLCSPDGTVLYANSFGARQFGLTPKTIVGRRQQDLFPPDVAARHCRAIQGVLETGHPFITEAPGPLGAGDKEVWIDTRLIPIKDAAGKGSAVLGLSRDVTDRKQSEAKMIEYQEELRRLTSEIVMTEERERRRIALDLHDGVGQTLALCNMKLGALRAGAGKTAQARLLGEAEALLQDAIRDTRALTVQLSPPVLYELGLEAALAWLAEHVGSRHGLPVELRRAGGPLPALPQALSLTVFHSVRELVLNVVKHARASRALIEVRSAADHVDILIEDDGRGFDLSAPRPDTRLTGGFGLFSIRERLRSLGGRLDIESTVGHGTRAVLTVPLGPDARAGKELRHEHPDRAM